MTHSPTYEYCEHAALYSPNASTDAPDSEECQSAVTSAMVILADSFTDSCMASETEDLLWQMINIYHRKAQALERLLDASFLRQRDLTEQQDGSEISSVKLESAMEGTRKIELQLQVITAMRDAGIASFSSLTGSAWLPKTGSVARKQPVTAAMLDSRDMANARHLQKITRLIPAGKRIAIAPGDFNNHTVIWDTLDKFLHHTTANNQALVLLHGGSKCPVERITALWAKSRKVDQVLFTPEFNRHGKAAAFKRNDALITEMPAGLLVFGNNEDNGIQQQLIRTARSKGIKVHYVPSGT